VKNHFSRVRGSLHPLVNIKGDGKNIAVSVSGSGVTIRFIGSVSATFTGVAYSPSGVKTAGLNTYADRAWVRYSATDDAFTEQIGPPASPWGADEVWYEKAHTYGDIVVTRF
jgi:hypothetical protein